MKRTALEREGPPRCRVVANTKETGERTADTRVIDTAHTDAEALLKAAVVRREHPEWEVWAQRATGIGWRMIRG